MLENIKSSYDLSKEKYPKDLSADMKADYTAVAGESEDVREQVISAYMGATGYSRRHRYRGQDHKLPALQEIGGDRQ